MKFDLSLSTLAILAAATSVHAGEPPVCQVRGDVPGFENCKNYFFVNGKASDMLWCLSKSDCLKVFPEPTPIPTPEPTQAPVPLPAPAPVQIASAEQALESTSTMARASGAALLVAAVAALF